MDMGLRTEDLLFNRQFPDPRSPTPKPWSRATHGVPFVALPSMTVVHLAPSGEISYWKEYDVGESTFIVNRPFIT